MSGRSEQRDGESVRTWLRGVLVVVVIAGVLGVFGAQTRLKRPALSSLNLAGVGVMLAGLAVALLARRIARSREDAVPFVKLGGVLLCGIGAAMVFL